MIPNTPDPNDKSSLHQIFEKRLFDKTYKASIDHSSTQIFSEISSNINPFHSLVPNNSTNPLSQIMLEKFNTLKSPDQEFKEIFETFYKIKP